MTVNEALQELNEAIGEAFRAFGESPELMKVARCAAVVGIFMKERRGDRGGSVAKGSMDGAGGY